MKYSSHQPDPYSAFYAGEALSVIEKAASDMVVISDVLSPSTVLALVAEDDIRKNFRKDAADKIAEARGCAVENPAQASGIFQQLSPDLNKDFLRLVLQAA